jgi:hypothetical protein
MDKTNRSDDQNPKTTNNTSQDDEINRKPAARSSPSSSGPEWR